MQHSFKDVPKHLITALSQLGQAEYDDNSSIPENPNIADYLKSVNIKGDDEIPWCSAFVNWSLHISALVGTQSGLARSFLTFSTELIEPELGCICVFSRGSNPNQGHVGFYLDDNKNYVYLLGGNQGNRVSIKMYGKSSLLSYRKVTYLPDLTP